MRIYAIAGKKRSGKTTAAEIIQHEYRHPQYNNARPHILALARPIKRAVSSILYQLGITSANVEDYIEGRYKEAVLPTVGVTPRQLMQVIGTEVGRSLSLTLWIDIFKHSVATLSSEHRVIIVPDVRFENEAKALRKMGAVFIHLQRDGLRSDSHASEQGIRMRKGDYIVNNNGTKAELTALVRSIVQEVEGDE